MEEVVERRVLALEQEQEEQRAMVGLLEVQVDQVLPASTLAALEKQAYLIIS